MDKTMGIYKITCLISDKYYIGSSKEIERRWIQHKSDLRNKRHHCKGLQNAWNKYGSENFKFEVVEIVNDKELLIEREQFYLDKFKSYNSRYGYNSNTNASGGGGAKGERNGWYKKGHLRRGALNNFYGKTHTFETRNKLSLCASKRIGELNNNYGNKGFKNPLSKPIAQINTKNSTVIKIWGCSSELEDNAGFPRTSVIAVCKEVEELSQWREYKGFYWCYEKDLNKLKNFVLKTVVQLEKTTGELINIFNSVSEASKKLGVNSENISRVCKGKNKTSGGYKWMYLEDYENEYLNII